MKKLTERVERQRALVRRLRAQIAFEALILARLEQRSDTEKPASRDLRAVLARAMERRAGGERTSPDKDA